MLPDALGEALAMVIAEQRREWRMHFDREMAEVRALLADARRENSELRTELEAQSADAVHRVDDALAAALAMVKDGAQGPPGRDGIGLKDLLIDRDGVLVAACDDGSLRRIGVVVGRDGKDGTPGRDGLGFDDLTVQNEGRSFAFRFVRGADIKEFRFEVPVMLYRHVYRDGEQYVPGDVVTRAGSLWHCDAATCERPGEGSNAWTLAAKRGRDGKDGKDGERGPPGPAGERGRDLTQMLADGTKY